MFLTVVNWRDCCYFSIGTPSCDFRSVSYELGLEVLGLERKKGENFIRNWEIWKRGEKEQEQEKMVIFKEKNTINWKWVEI